MSTTPSPSPTSTPSPSLTQEAILRRLRINSAILSSTSGRTINVEFSRGTNEPTAELADVTDRDLLSKLTCPLLFTDTTIAAVGSTNTRCIWLSPSRLRVILGEDTTLKHDTFLTFQEGVLTTADGSEGLYERSKGLTFEAAVVALIVGPSSSGPCDEIELDGSLSEGSYGRDLSFNWTVSLYDPSSPANASLPEPLYLGSSRRILAKPLELELPDLTDLPTLIRWTLVVTNWLGQHSPPFHHLMSINPSAAPQLSLVSDIYLPVSPTVLMSPLSTKVSVVRYISSTQRPCPDPDIAAPPDTVRFMYRYRCWSQIFRFC